MNYIYFYYKLPNLKFIYFDLIQYYFFSLFLIILVYWYLYLDKVYLYFKYNRFSTVVKTKI